MARAPASGLDFEDQPPTYEVAMAGADDSSLSTSTLRVGRRTRGRLKPISRWLRTILEHGQDVRHDGEGGTPAPSRAPGDTTATPYYLQSIDGIEEDFTDEVLRSFSGCLNPRHDSDAFETTPPNTASSSRQQGRPYYNAQEYSTDSLAQTIGGVTVLTASDSTEIQSLFSTTSAERHEYRGPARVASFNYLARESYDHEEDDAEYDRPLADWRMSVPGHPGDTWAKQEWRDRTSQTSLRGRHSPDHSVEAIPCLVENDAEILGLMADSLMLSDYFEANLRAWEETSSEPRAKSLQATLPIEYLVCGQSVQGDSTIRVQENRALHLQCCRDSPPPSYSSESSYHSMLDGATGAARSVLRRDRGQLSVQVRSNPGDPRNVLPMELWEMVIDALVDEPEALIACASVCKSWYSRCWMQLSQGVLHLSHRRDVLRLSRYVRAHWTFANRELVTIRGGTDGSLSHLPTFTALLAGRLPRLESLEVEHGVWRTGMTDVDFFTRAASFTFISRLTLNDITLPSTSIFAQFVCSFEQLTELYLISVRTIKKRTGSQLHLPLACQSKLRHLTVTGPDVHDLVEFLTLGDLATSLVSLAMHVGFVSCRHIVWLDAGAYHNLLSASQSLRALHLQYCDSEDTKVKDACIDAVLVYYLNVVKPRTIEVLHITVEPHLRGDYEFRRLTTLLSYLNSSGALRELVITFDIQGEKNEAAHQCLLALLSDETDLTALDGVLGTRSYAKLESVEVVLRVGHLESRFVKSREVIWMERIEAQVRKTRLRGILSVRVKT